MVIFGHWSPSAYSTTHSRVAIPLLNLRYPARCESSGGDGGSESSGGDGGVHRYPASSDLSLTCQSCSARPRVSSSQPWPLAAAAAGTASLRSSASTKCAVSPDRSRRKMLAGRTVSLDPPRWKKLALGWRQLCGRSGGGRSAARWWKKFCRRAGQRKRQRRWPEKTRLGRRASISFLCIYEAHITVDKESTSLRLMFAHLIHLIHRNITVGPSGV